MIRALDFAKCPLRSKVLRRTSVCLTICGLLAAGGGTPLFAQTGESEARLIAQAHALRLRLKPEEAVRVLNHAAALYPKSVTIYGLRSDTQKDCGNMKEALLDLEKALAIAPGNLELIKKRAKVNDITGNLKEAITDYDYILTRQPKDRRTWSERAIACKRLKMYAQAAHDFNQAALCTGADRGLHDILYDRTQMYMLAGEAKQAMLSANELIQKFPELSRGYWLRAQLYDKHSQAVLAAKDRARATDIDENFDPMAGR